LTRLLRKFLIGFSLLASCDLARAGAALWPAYSGQIISGFTLDDSTSAFDAKGHLSSAAGWRKSELTSFLEYGASDNVTLVAGLALGSISASSPSRRAVAFEPTELGARVGLWSSANQVLSAQATLRTPTIPTRSGALFVDGPDMGADARLLYSTSFHLLGMATFAEIQFGYRLNGDAWRGETHADITLGLRPWDRILVLLQSFGRRSPTVAGSPKIEFDDKAQLSLVYDISTKWSAQVGGFMTVAGVNAPQERGGVLALWRRF